jgi:hypothetical protein
MPLLKFGMKEIKTLELSFILFGWGLSVNILLLLSWEGGWEFPWAYRAGRGRQPPPPPRLLGKQSQLGNIRFTVGQYWLIIKIMGQILSILWEILSIFWEICYLIGIFRNHFSPTRVDNNFGKFSPEIFF